MKLYTSYFAQLRNFPPNLVGLSTAVWNPKWLQPGRDKKGAIWLDCPPLKPGIKCEGLCNGKCRPLHPDTCQFLKTYRAQLDKINFKQFISHLQLLSNTIKIGEQLDEDVDFAFLVYEPDYKLCSERRQIQQWFKDNGMEIKEWGK